MRESTFFRGQNKMTRIQSCSVNTNCSLFSAFKPTWARWGCAGDPGSPMGLEVAVTYGKHFVWDFFPDCLIWGQA